MFGLFENKQGKLLIKEAARTLDKADGLEEQDKKSIANFLIKKMIKSMKEIEGLPVPSSKLDEILKKQVNETKSTCKELDFEEATDRFVDCNFKLYMQSVELAAKNNQQIVMQPQSSGSNVMTIYDPVRDSRALMRQGQRMLSGACTLGINC